MAPFIPKATSCPQSLLPLPFGSPFFLTAMLFSGSTNLSSNWHLWFQNFPNLAATGVPIGFQSFLSHGHTLVWKHKPQLKMAPLIPITTNDSICWWFHRLAVNSVTSPWSLLGIRTLVQMASLIAKITHCLKLLLLLLLFQATSPFCLMTTLSSEFTKLCSKFVIWFQKPVTAWSHSCHHQSQTFLFHGQALVWEYYLQFRKDPWFQKPFTSWRHCCCHG